MPLLHEIQTLIEEKKAKKIIPASVCELEITTFRGEELRKRLTKLVNEKKLNYYKGANRLYFYEN
jgi:hypothetical protein